MNLLYQVIRIGSKVLALEDRLGRVASLADLYADMICDATRILAGAEIKKPAIKTSSKSFGAFGYYDYTSDAIFITGKCTELGDRSIAYVVAHEIAHYVRRHLAGESVAQVYDAKSFLKKAAEEAAGVFCGLYFAYGNLSAQEMLCMIERQGHPEGVLMAWELKRLLNDGMTEEFARENADSPFLEDSNADRVGRHIAALTYAKMRYSKEATLANMIMMKRKDIVEYAFGEPEKSGPIKEEIISMLEPVSSGNARSSIANLLR